MDTQNPSYITRGVVEEAEDFQVGRRYRFDHLTLPLVLRDMRFRYEDPAPGGQVPEFDLPTLGGSRFRSADLGEMGPALLVFGSYTCPITDSAAPGLKELHARFGDRVRFVMVNVREAHPGKSVPQPQIFEQKMGHAKQLRDLHSFEFEVAVDDINGTFHRALSPKPNSAYILGQDGKILFRALWANDTKGIAAALDAVVKGKSPIPFESRGLLRPMLRLARYIAPVLDRAGEGAWRDMWLVAPPLASLAMALKTLGFRPRKSLQNES